MVNANRDALWEILETYSETVLFHDWNHPAVNQELREFAADIEDWARKATWTEPLYEYGMRFVGDTKNYHPTTKEHIDEVRTWHNGTYEFARRVAPGEWERVE